MKNSEYAMKHKPTGKLADAQIKFIEDRVKEFTSILDVDLFYAKNDTVCIYARQFARTIFKEGDKSCQDGNEKQKNQQHKRRWKRSRGD